MLGPKLGALVTAMLVLGGSIAQTLFFNKVIGIPQAMVVTLPVSMFIGWNFLPLYRYLTRKEEEHGSGS